MLLLLFVPMIYCAFCAYFAMFRMKLCDFYALHAHHSDAVRRHLPPPLLGTYHPRGCVYPSSLAQCCTRTTPTRCVRRRILATTR